MRQEDFEKHTEEQQATMLRDQLEAMRGWCRTGYERSQEGMEEAMGMPISFEDWLVLQLTIFSRKGPPKPGEGFVP